LEIQFGLEKITDEQREASKLFLKKVEYEKGDVKHQISNVLKNVSDYKFRTFGEYSALLSCFNVEAKTVKGIGIDGKPFNGIVYSAMDDTGKVVSNPFKSSLFGKTFGHIALNKQMERNEKALKDGKYAPMIRGAIAETMRATHNKEKFISLLRTKGIDAVFRINDAGRLYGATFIDHNRKEVYNGSALGKEFSANSLNQNFNKIDEIDKISDTKSCQSFNPDNHGSDIHGSDLFGIFDLPFTQDNSDYEEANFRRQTKRKKKKQQRHL